MRLNVLYSERLAKALLALIIFYDLMGKALRGFTGPLVHRIVIEFW